LFFEKNLLLLFSGITENKKSANEHSSQTTNNVKESLENLKKFVYNNGIRLIKSSVRLSLYWSWEN